MTSSQTAAISAIRLGDDLPLARAVAALAPAVEDGDADDLVALLAPDGDLGEAARGVIQAAAQAHPDAIAFTLQAAGLAADPAWRGRRCRSHERNLESLHFASLIAPGALVVRRAALRAALAVAPLSDTPDAWRELTRRIARGGRVVRLGETVHRLAPLPGEPPCPGFAPPRSTPHVLVLGQIEVSTSLYFDALEASAEVDVGFRALTRLSVDAPHLAAADLVILVRTLHRFWDEGVIAFLEAAGTPWVWFADDNFQTLAAERDAPTFFTAGRMRRALVGAAAVWASTPALATALAPLHPRTEVWGPALDPALAGAAAHPTAGPLTIGVNGGDFRAAGLAGAALEQLRGLAAQAPLRLVASGAAAGVLAGGVPAAEIVARPTERSFRQFIRQWRADGLDLLLHPAGATANSAYKCPTAAITAGYLGAVPVVAGEPAYDGWGEAEGVLRIGADGAGLADAAARARDPAWRGDMRQRLARTLAARFHVRGRAERLRALMRAAPGADAAGRLLATPSFSARRAALSLAHATRRLRDAVRRPG